MTISLEKDSWCNLHMTRYVQFIHSYHSFDLDVKTFIGKLGFDKKYNLLLLS